MLTLVQLKNCGIDLVKVVFYHTVQIKVRIVEIVI